MNSSSVKKMETEEEMNRTGSNATQESQQNKILYAKDSSDERVCGDSKDDEKKNPGKNRDCSIDIKGDANVVSRNSESANAERICRICHFGDESSSEGSEHIELGCDCKGELGWLHQHCAEAWFWQKGDRQCEICGTMAKNIDNKSAEDTSLFLMEWNEMSLVAAPSTILRRARYAASNIFADSWMYAWFSPSCCHGFLEESVFFRNNCIQYIYTYAP